MQLYYQHHKVLQLWATTIALVNEISFSVSSALVLYFPGAESATTENIHRTIGIMPRICNRADNYFSKRLNTKLPLTKYKAHWSGLTASAYPPITKFLLSFFRSIVPKPHRWLWTDQIDPITFSSSPIKLLPTRVLSYFSPPYKARFDKFAFIIFPPSFILNSFLYLIHFFTYITIINYTIPNI